MDFSLSSSLVGSAVSNPDKLALDLQFATDKTLTARKGPTPVFTRGSGATFVDSDGLVKYAPENLILQSENLTTTWVTSSTAIGANTEVAPNGTTTADTATASNAGSNFLAQQITVIASTQYTFSFYVKRGSATNATYSVYNNNASNDIVALTSYFSQTSSSAWVRVSFQFTTPVGCTSIFAYMQRNTGSTGSMHFWGAQVERSSIARAYIPTTTAAVYAPRFDHDPVSLACKGLLIEESRTNTLIQSNDFANVAWVKSNIGIGSTTNLSPDGSNNATLLIAGTASVSWIFRSGITNSGSTVTFFAKSSGKRWAVVDASSGAGTAGVWFDLQNGVVGTVQSGYTASIQQFPNGFYRCRVTYPSSGAGTFCVIGVSDNDGLFTSTASGSNGIIFYGAQLEAGSFPTSYIPTTTASVIRSADVCSITGSDFTSFYNQSEGSFACNYSILASFTGNRYAASIEDTAGGTQNGFVFRNTNSALSFIAGSGYTSTIGSVTTGVSKHILAYSGLTEFVYVKDGVVGTVTGSGTRNPSLPISMSIGSLEGSFISCGHIASIRYYKKRLPNAKLQTLTV